MTLISFLFIPKDFRTVYITSWFIEWNGFEKSMKQLYIALSCLAVYFSAKTLRMNICCTVLLSFLKPVCSTKIYLEKFSQFTQKNPGTSCGRQVNLTFICIFFENKYVAYFSTKLQVLSIMVGHLRMGTPNAETSLKKTRVKQG